jgi:hypothetical protein
MLRNYPETYFCHPGGVYGVWSPNPSNEHLARRMSDGKRRMIQRPDYQVPEYRCFVPRASTRMGDEGTRYLHHLYRMSTTRRSSCLYPEDRIDTRVGPTTTNLVIRWYSGSPDMGILDMLKAYRRV